MMMMVIVDKMAGKRKYQSPLDCLLRSANEGKGGKKSDRTASLVFN